MLRRPLASKGLSPNGTEARKPDNIGTGTLNLPQPLFTKRGESFLLILMSVVSFIEKLQKKPRYVRIQIMWAGVILSSFIVTAFWLWSLSVSLAESAKAPVSGGESLQKLNNIRKDVPSLWQSLSAGVGNIVDTAKTDLNNSAPTSTPSPEAQRTDKLPIEQ